MSSTAPACPARLNAVLLAHSAAPSGHELVTFLLPRLPKPLFGQLAKHRMLSMSAASSRAVPLEKLIQELLEDGYVPTWTAKQSGMGGQAITDTRTTGQLETVWRLHRDDAINAALRLHRIGGAKEVCNRLLEPFARLPVVVTGTEWENFYRLRTHEGAQADLRQTALEMQRLVLESTPKALRWGEWHVPFARELPLDDALASSAAACARCSYMNHGGEFSLEKDRALALKLVRDHHMTPFEHQAEAVPGAYANFRDWRSRRFAMGG